jgi:hypothetical protein
MLELADIVRAVGPETCAELAILPSQKRALEAILQCRTPVLGGEVYQCDHCAAFHYSYHSCGNRHCPKCQGQQTQHWLDQQRESLLPCGYYLLTFTLPAELRALARSHQKKVYGLMMSCAAASVQTLCADPRWLGAQPSLLGVLHTWTRDLRYHPHAHFLVSAGGLSPDGQRWIPLPSRKFLVPVHALSQIFAAKMRDALQAAGLQGQGLRKLWSKSKPKAWVVHAQPAGQGEQVLDYLGRYVFRIAITHSRLEQLADGQVTFRYRDNTTQQLRHCCLPAREFLQRFLQHVLPKGFAKVRHYGLASTACVERRKQARALLLKAIPVPKSRAPTPTISRQVSESARPSIDRCPVCHLGHLRWVARLLPQQNRPP